MPRGSGFYSIVERIWLELAESLATTDAVQPTMDIHIDVVADEADGSITERGVNTTNMGASRCSLAITTSVASQAKSRLITATMDVC